MQESGCCVDRALLSKTKPILRTVSGGNVSLTSSLTGKRLMTLFRCCLGLIMISSVLSGLSFSLLKVGF